MRNETAKPKFFEVTPDQIANALNAAGGFVGPTQEDYDRAAQYVCDREDEIWYRLAKDLANDSL